MNTPRHTIVRILKERGESLLNNRGVDPKVAREMADQILDRIASTSKSGKIEVWVTIYSHEHGIDVEVYPTDEAAQKAKADTARRWWEDRTDQDAPDDHSQLTDNEVNEAYWHEHDSEYFEIEQRTLRVP